MHSCWRIRSRRLAIEARQDRARAEIVVVSGLPRSGTSMMMQMLAAAGWPLLVDDVRPANPDNPRGFFEFEPVKRIGIDSRFLSQAVGRVVKIVAPLLPKLPDDFDYRVIWMERDMASIMASQRVMLGRADGVPHEDAIPGGHEEATLARAQAGAAARARRWAEAASHVRIESIEYRAVIARPRVEARRVLEFIGSSGNPEAAHADATRIEAAASVVDPLLCRHESRQESRPV